jgi:hypothetical protein
MNPFGLTFIAALGMAAGYGAFKLSEGLEHQENPMPTKRLRLTKAQIEKLYDEVVISSARENAFATEELTQDDKRNETLAFAEIVYLSATGIIDSMYSEREYSNYVSAPLSEATYDKLRARNDAEFAWMKEYRATHKNPIEDEAWTKIDNDTWVRKGWTIRRFRGYNRWTIDRPDGSSIMGSWSPLWRAKDVADTQIGTPSPTSAKITKAWCRALAVLNAPEQFHQDEWPRRDVISRLEKAGFAEQYFYFKPGFNYQHYSYRLTDAGRLALANRCR